MRASRAAGAPPVAGLRRFDTADRSEMDALPPAVRNAVIADRQQRVTAALRRYVVAGGRARIAPRADVVAGVRR